MRRYAIILCGGSGTRLWPLSRTLRPKQLLALNGEQTLLQQTATRLLAHVDASNLFTVTHEDHKFEVKGQLAEVAPAAIANVLAEPCARNTLPAIAWAVHKINQQDPNAMIGVFASDHAIDNQPAFLDARNMEERANFKIKHIVVNPGAKLSMQLHKHRSEHWVVLSGEATISNNEIEYKLQENQSAYIPKTHKHRLANEGSQPLSIIEVQCGDYVGEDDIVRFDDNYGRVEE